MFPFFEHVPFYPLVFAVFWGAALLFVLAMARHLRVFAAGRAERPSPFDSIPARLAGLIEYAFVQTKMFKDPGRRSSISGSSGASSCSPSGRRTSSPAGSSRP